MHLTTIEIRNFIALQLARVELGAANLFVGKNGSGKTSVADAIRFAVKGDPVRVAYKKDMAQLLFNNAPRGSVSLTFNSGEEISRDVGTGKANHETGSAVNLEFALNANAFAAKKPEQRRAILSEILSLNFAEEEIIKAVEDKVVINDMVREMTRQAAGGDWDGVAKRLRDNAALLRGQWQQITGERYGKQKANTWQMNADIPDAPLQHVAEKAEKLQEEYQQLHDELTGSKKMATEFKRRSDSLKLQVEQERVTLNGLAEKYGDASILNKFVEANAGKIKTMQEERDVLVRHGEDLNRQAGVVSANIKAASTLMQCPCCDHSLRLENGKLIEADSIDVSALQAQLNLINQTKNQMMLQYREVDTAIGNAQSASREACGARAKMESCVNTIDMLEKQIGSLVVPETKDVHELENKCDQMRQNAAEAQKQCAKVKMQHEAVEIAETKTVDALKLHQQVMLSEQLADVFGPNGVRRNLVQEALEPFNEQLAAMTLVAQWGEIGIDGDMELYLNNRPFGLLSRSEQWRVNVLVTKALCDMAGVGVVIFDEVDILDDENLNGFKALLCQFANEHVQVIAMATGYPDAFSSLNGVNVFEVENGTIVNTNMKIAA